MSKYSVLYAARSAGALQACQLVRHSLLRFCRQHKQFALELAELTYVVHVIGEGRHYVMNQCVGAFWGVLSGYHKQFVVLDALAHHFETQRYKDSVVFWVRIYDGIIPGGKHRPSAPIRLNIFKRPIRPEVSAPMQVTSRSEERRVGKECRSRWAPY